MIDLELPRGTAAWRRALVGRITPSDAQALMARRDSKAWARLVERLVLDVETGAPHTVEFPDPWHEKHEEAVLGGLAAYEKGSAEEVRRGGLVVHDNLTWLGASPHGFVGDGGVAFVRPHRSLRAYAKAIGRVDSRSFRARVQLLLHVTGRAWCDVFDFWDGGGLVEDRSHAERVDATPEWLVANVFPRLVAAWTDVRSQLRIRAAGAVVRSGESHDRQG